MTNLAINLAGTQALDGRDYDGNVKSAEIKSGGTRLHAPKRAVVCGNGRDAKASRHTIFRRRYAEVVIGRDLYNAPTHGDRSSRRILLSTVSTSTLTD